MKIISLNVAGRSNFGGNFDKRMQEIAAFFDAEQADIICMQEVTFSEKESLAERINRYMAKPYKYVSAHMSEKYTFDRFTDRFMKKWELGLVEHDGDYVTDGMAILSKEPIIEDVSIIMKPAPADERGKPDVRVRLSQIIKLQSGLILSNVHFATNDNAYFQLQELIDSRDTDIIVGDFNIFTDVLNEHKSIWGQKYEESTDFKEYISFPDENATFDHMLLKPTYKFVNIETHEGLSDHAAIIYTIE